MIIGNSILKHYLKNVYFINGTAYAGKSTMVAMLAERYDMIHCGENYHSMKVDLIANPEEYPNLSYFKTMEDWQEFLNRTPADYLKWIQGSNNELIEFEIAELIHISQNKKVIVDTNIPINILREIASYNQIAIMLSSQVMSVDKFFERGDPDKQFLLSQINKAKDPARTMSNFLECIALANSSEIYQAFANSGFFTIVRGDEGIDTKEEVIETLAKHFGLSNN